MESPPFIIRSALKPRGKHVCSVCLGTACHVRGGPVIADEFQRGARREAWRDHRRPRVHARNGELPGRCALGPIVVVDGHYFSNVTPAGVKDVVEKSRAGLDSVEVKTDQRIFPVEVSLRPLQPQPDGRRASRRWTSFRSG